MTLKLKQFFCVFLCCTLVGSNLVWAVQLPAELIGGQRQSPALAAPQPTVKPKAFQKVPLQQASQPAGQRQFIEAAPLHIQVKPEALNLATLLLGQPVANVVSLDLDAKPQAVERAWLHYQLEGLGDASGVVRSLNDETALGGMLSGVQAAGQWQNVVEEIRPQSLREGVNLLRFNLPQGAKYQYAVRHVRLEVKLAARGAAKRSADLVLSVPVNREHAGTQLYVRGFVQGVDVSQVKQVVLNGQAVALQHGYFEQVLKRDAKQAQQPWVLQAGVPAVRSLLARSFTFNGSGASGQAQQQLAVAPEKAFLLAAHRDTHIAHEGMSLSFVAGSVKRDTQITARSLRAVDMAQMEQGMANVTGSRQYPGYRLLPHGSTFDKAATIRIGYDRSKLPGEMREEDIRSYYFNEASNRWVALERVGIDTVKQQIISRTEHFTDFINAVVKAPDAPTSKGFSPTQMSGIKAANPSAGIDSIAPPKANGQGSANLSYPLSLPAGRGGMQPQLGVSYNSDGGNGWMGMGWEMSVPSISIDTRWGAPRYLADKESEIYLLNGQQLIRKGSAGLPQRIGNLETRPSSGRVEFSQRIEGAFARIVRIGNSPSTYAWEVTSKDGTTSYFGGSASDGDEPVLRTHTSNIGHWALREVRDSNDNWMRYSYQLRSAQVNGGAGSEGKELYLDEIRYTGHAGGGFLGLGINSPGYAVKFVRQSNVRRDVRIDGRLGLLRTNADLLREVRVSYKGSAVRSYRFNYQEGPFFKQLLKEIVQHDGSATDVTTPVSETGVLHRYTFNYFNEINPQGTQYTPYVGRSDWPTPDDNLKGNLALSMPQFEDKVSAINGSKNKSSGSGIYLGIGPAGDYPASLFSVANPFSVGFSTDSSKSESEGLSALTDIDGDNLPDKVVHRGGILYYKNLSSPDGGNSLQFSSSAQGVAALSRFSRDKNKTRSTGFKVNGPGFVSFGSSNSKSTSTGDVYFSDANGDGLIDVVDGGQVLFNQGDANAFASSTLARYGSNYSSTPNPLRAGTLIQTEPLNALLQENAAELSEEKRLAPAHDVVRVWEAPFGGSINISAAVSLLDAASSEDNLDGVQVSIQHKNVVLWQQVLCQNNALTCEAIGQPGVKLSQATPSNLTNIRINAGERLYFRAHTRDNGEADQLRWNPIINYTAVDGASNNVDTPQAAILANYPDANGQSWTRYSASDSFTLSQRPGEFLRMPIDGTVLLQGAYNANAGQAHVSLKVYRVDAISRAQQLVYEGESAGLLNLSLRVKAGDGLRLIFDGQANIHWAGVSWNVKATYTQASDPKIMLRLPSGAYQIHFDTFPEYSATTRLLRRPLRLIFDPAFVSNRYEMTPQISAGSASGTVTVAITSVGNMSPLTQDYRIENGAVVSGQQSIDTTGFPFVHQFSHLYVDFYFSSEDLAEAALATTPTGRYAKWRMISREGATTDYEPGVYAKRDARLAVSGARSGNAFGIMYRHWGQFIYNGAAPWGSAPIDETQLGFKQDVAAINADASTISSSNPLSGFNPASQRFLAMNVGMDLNAGEASNTVTQAPVQLGGDDLTWVSTDTVSTSRLGNDDFAPPMVRAAQVVSLAAAQLDAINRISKDKSSAQYLGPYSRSESESRGILDFMDLNGDNYPDIVSPAQVQYTLMHGGREAAMRNLNVARSGIRGSSSESESFDVASIIGMGYALATSGGGNQQNTAPGSNGGDQSPNKAAGSSKPPLGPSLSLGQSESTGDFEYIDINGDGLPDRVDANNATVQLNVGYGFTPSANWNFDEITLGKGINSSAGLGYQFDNYSLGAGVSLTRGDNNTQHSFTDINGDGLVDVLKESGSGVDVLMNTGNRFVAVSWQGGAQNENSSISQGMSLHFTVGIPILPEPYPYVVRILINPNAFTSRGVDTVKNSFSDLNGDGWPEYMESDHDGDLKVYLNKTGKTNLLKTVSSSLAGGRIELDYSRRGNTYNLPQSHWVLASSTVFDGVLSDSASTDADILKQRFSYGAGYYDRREREFYGFDRVTTTDLDTLNSDAPYRISEQRYHNRDYYRKGLLKESELRSSAGAVYTRSRSQYELRLAQEANAVFAGTVTVSAANKEENASLYPALVRSEEINLEQTANETHKLTRSFSDFNRYGDARQITEEGTAAGNNMRVVLDYLELATPYIVGEVQSIRITDLASGTLLRARSSTFDEGGNLLSVSANSDAGKQVTTRMSYDDYGNVLSVTRPANREGQALAYSYQYDSSIATHVTQITDSYGYRAQTEYEFKWGGAVKVERDINDQEIRYSYDKFGRLASVIGPYEIAANQPFSLSFSYAPKAVIPYAISRHFDEERPADTMDTYTFMDGLQRVIQTKKDAAIANGSGDSTDMVVVSGKSEYDGVGRAYRQYYPLEELRGRETTYNRNVDSIAPQVSQFDHRDRSTRSTLQDGTELTDSYTLGSGGVAVHTRISAEINSAGSGLRATTSRSTDGRGRIVRVDEPNGVFATYDYDAVNQLLHVTHSGNSYAKASVVYDLLGRRLSTTHPSTGTMQYVYDDASNLLRKVTQKLANSDNNKAIRYQYEFERLTHIFYPTLDTNNTGATAPQYDVQYVYGDASSGAKAKNQAGRMMRVIEKAVGEQRFEYGPAGELVRQVRILSDILSTNDSNPQESRWFETRYRYDTWNRIQNMSYPDGEVLSYGYDSGGLLQSLSGQKGSMGYAYVNHRNYDKFGQMRYLALGDLSETEHQYDAVRNRLQHLTVSSKQSAELAELLKLQYSYDPMSNIVKLVDNKSSFSRHGLGGRSDQTFSYDANMRLRAAQGNLNVLDKGQALQHSYWLVMAYDTLQRIALKSVATITNPPPALLKNYALSYQYEDRSKPYQVTRMEGAFAQSGTIAGWNHAISPEYDDNGNLTRSEAGQGSMNLAWDDENRLIEVKNESGDISRYRYGHDGERAIQQTPDGQTLYVNPNFTVRSVTGADGSQSVRSRVATKHIFVGSERIATKRVESSGTKLASNLFNRVNCAMPANSVTAFLVDVFKRNAISCPNLNATDSLISDVAIIKQEKESYFYHSDHLGSVGIVTRDGELYDYAIFLPFGEQWVFQSQNSAAQNQGTKGEGINPLTPFQFTGKELDKYTGLTYFGARYYDPHTSLWLSPDPIWEEYLGTNPDDLTNEGMFRTVNMNVYNYTLHNPVNMMDPDGNYAETPLDVANVAMGVKSFKKNLAEGNLFGAAVDALGIVFDLAATVTPVPAFAGATIKVIRASDDAFDAAKAAKTTHSAKSARAVGGPVFKTTKEAAAAAEALGYKKISARVQGKKEAVFTKDGNYITRDRTGHNGGAWKSADSVKGLESKKGRTGTWNANLSQRIGK